MSAPLISLHHYRMQKSCAKSLSRLRKSVHDIHGTISDIVASLENMPDSPAKQDIEEQIGRVSDSMNSAVLLAYDQLGAKLLPPRRS